MNNEIFDIFAEYQDTRITEVFTNCGRSSGVRTHDLYVPNVALYQAELYSVVSAHITTQK